MGFRPAIETTLRALPPRATRQTLLFSATFPAQVIRDAYHDTIRVTVYGAADAALLGDVLRARHPS